MCIRTKSTVGLGHRIVPEWEARKPISTNREKAHVNVAKYGANVSLECCVDLDRSTTARAKSLAIFMTCPPAAGCQTLSGQLPRCTSYFAPFDIVHEPAPWYGVLIL